MTTTMMDLDAAVAKALGWVKPSERTPPRCDVCGWPLVPEGESGCWASNCSVRPHPEPRADRIATYSTDPARIADMWKHLWREPVIAISVSQCMVGAFDAVANFHFPDREEHYDDISATGDTIQHALALLVVAVSNKLAGGAGKP